jgi:5'-nucleotidase
MDRAPAHLRISQARSMCRCPQQLNAMSPITPLNVGMSSSTLFDTTESDACYRAKSLNEYVQHQIDRLDVPFPKGTAFPLAEVMKHLNQEAPPRQEYFRLTVMSKNEPDAGHRVMKSLAHYGFQHPRAAFTGGEPIGGKCAAMEVELFLSREESEVIAALKAGIGAGRLYNPPSEMNVALNQLRVAFDFDGVLASLEAELVYQRNSMDAYRAHEVEKANQPLDPGPLHSVLMKLAAIKGDITARRKARFTPGAPVIPEVLAKALEIDLTDASLIAASTEAPEILFRTDEKHLTEAGFTQEEAQELAHRIRVFFSPIEIALVTARNPPVEERLMTTLKKWGVQLDQMYLMGGLPKEPVLKEFKPHIFFDDTMKYIESAKDSVPVGWVPPFELAPALSVAAEPVSSTTTAAAPTSPGKVINTVTLVDFETGCRKVFNGYMPDADGKKQPLDPRFRDFIDEHKKRTPADRATILRRLERYDLSGMGATHQPKLSRSRSDHLVRKLKEIAGELAQPGSNISNSTNETPSS